MKRISSCTIYFAIFLLILVPISAQDSYDYVGDNNTVIDENSTNQTNGTNDTTPPIKVDPIPEVSSNLSLVLGISIPFTVVLVSLIVFIKANKKVEVDSDENETPVESDDKLYNEDRIWFNYQTKIRCFGSLRK